MQLPVQLMSSCLSFWETARFAELKSTRSSVCFRVSSFHKINWLFSGSTTSDTSATVVRGMKPEIVDGKWRIFNWGWKSQSILRKLSVALPGLLGVYWGNKPGLCNKRKQISSATNRIEGMPHPSFGVQHIPTMDSDLQTTTSILPLCMNYIETWKLDFHAANTSDLIGNASAFA